jgi:CheY-like chemotaxis protein
MWVKQSAFLNEPITMKQRILIADDDESIRDIFQLILGNAGYEIEITSNGENILNNSYVVPDLFLLDKQLAGHNGLDICMHLKNNPETKDIPVIMISASPDIGPLSIAAGADAYIEKPFEIEYLRSVIRHYIQRPVTKI